jgi:hypothetical protein
MTLLNLAEPLSREDVSTIAAMCGRKVRKAIDADAAFATSQPMSAQVRALVDKLGLSAREWENSSLVLCLPADPVAAALIVAEIAGRRGRTPTIVRFATDKTTGRREPVETISLHEVRKEARHTRKGWALSSGSKDSGA